MRVAGNIQDKREIETAGGLDDRSAPAGAPEDRNAPPAALVETDLPYGVVRAPQDDAGCRRFPEPEEAFPGFVLPQVEEGFVEGELKGGRGRREFDELHGVE